MRFSPLLVSALIVKPLRYFFSTATLPQGLKWDEDEKISTIEIGTINDFNKIAIQQKPRILVSRGSYQIEKTGLTDNLAKAEGVKQSFGELDRINMVWINGVAQVIVEANQEGTCELLADMVSHFVVWTRPMLCDTQGFKEFGLGMQVSDCVPDKEDKDKFKVTISIPYMMEEHWNVKWETRKFHSLYASITPFAPAQLKGSGVKGDCGPPVLEVPERFMSFTI